MNNMSKLFCTIISNEVIATKTYKMVLEVPSPSFNSSFTTKDIVPGQFINIKIDGFFLRRPISICDWDDKTITIVYKVVGRGTEAMSNMASGDQLDVLLPLGNGYRNIDPEIVGNSPAVIGGGAGVPPMLGLCRELVALGKKPTAILGWNSADEVFLEDEFRGAGANVIIATADGSCGVKGFVTDVLTDTHYTSFFACGPEAMLRAVHRQAPDDITGWLSFEERMGCGFGACMGCSCKTKYGNKRICKDGPVLAREEVIW